MKDKVTCVCGIYTRSAFKGLESGPSSQGGVDTRARPVLSGLRHRPKFREGDIDFVTAPNMTRLSSSVTETSSLHGPDTSGAADLVASFEAMTARGSRLSLSRLIEVAADCSSGSRRRIQSDPTLSARLRHQIRSSVTGTPALSVFGIAGCLSLAAAGRACPLSRTPPAKQGEWRPPHGWVRWFESCTD